MRSNGWYYGIIIMMTLFRELIAIFSLFIHTICAHNLLICFLFFFPDLCSLLCVCVCVCVFSFCFRHSIDVPYITVSLDCANAYFFVWNIFKNLFFIAIWYQKPKWCRSNFGRSANTPHRQPNMRYQMSHLVFFFFFSFSRNEEKMLIILLLL